MNGVEEALEAPPADAGAIGQLSVVYNDDGEVLCKGVYKGTRGGRIWLEDNSGLFHSFPADKRDMRPSRDAQ